MAFMLSTVLTVPIATIVVILPIAVII
jgi:hypothetical protein